jgi:pre-mRNA-splicing factor ISY1
VNEREFVVHVLLPDEKEIEKMVLQKKKADLLNRYVIDVLMEEQTEAKDLLNIHRYLGSWFLCFASIKLFN